MKTKSELITLPTPEQPFTHFELDLDPAEKECLANFQIEKTADLNGIWEDLEQSLDQIKNFIDSIGKNDSHTCYQMVEIIFKIAHEALRIFKQESAYIMLRTFVPNEDFKIPRWHQDGYYFAPRSGLPLKAAIPLKGAGTLFYKASSSEFNDFKKVEMDREQAAKILVSESRKESTPPNHGSLFIVGSSGGAVHSEPYIISQRFFMSVLPGTKKQIEEWDAQGKLCDKLQKEGKSSEEIIHAVLKHVDSYQQAYINEQSNSLNL